MNRRVNLRARRARVTALVVGTVLGLQPIMALPAHAALGAVGTENPATGFPFWYQDANGLQLAECTEAPCPAVRPDTTQPLSFPGNFPDVAEDFYWAGWATINLPGGSQAILVESVLGGFLPDTTQGNQIGFGRIRIRSKKNLIPGASYTFTYPYGSKTFTADSLGSVNDTVDVGCLAAPCAGQFGSALGSQIGPFLTWDPAVAPAPPTGFIGDFNIPHRVVGSPTGNNFFRIDGPGIGGAGVNRVQTDQFQVAGRLVPGPVASLVPSALAFGTQPLRTPTATQTVTVSNAGALTLNVSGVGISGPGASDYQIVNDRCSGAALASGRTCAIGIRFTAGSIGSRAATLSISDNAPGGPHIVSLAGAGAGATAGTSTTLLDFATQNVGSSATPKVVSITNTGNLGLAVSNVSLTGSPDFVLRDDTCSGRTVAAGATCTTSVAFTPSSRGVRTGSLSIFSNSSDGTITIPVNGRGVAPLLVLTPTSIDFGKQLVTRASAERSVTVRNDGDAPLTIRGLAMNGNNASEFALSTNTCGATVAAGSSCRLGIRFTPAALGKRVASLRVDSDAPAANPNVVGLTGTGSLLLV